MSEMCAKVNAFFNNDIFLVGVTKFICCTNVCIFHVHLPVCVCSYPSLLYTELQVPVQPHMRGSVL